MITLIKFLEACGISIDPKGCKIHLASSNGYSHPIDEYYAGRFNEWQSWQKKKNFECKYVISLIEYGVGRWLFVGVYEVCDYSEDIERYGCKYKYDLSLLPNQGDLAGRIVVSYKRTSRASYLWAGNLNEKLVLGEVMPEKAMIEDFVGYNSVLVSFSKLKLVIEQEIPSWKGALSNVKGVYLITDTKTGKLYVGSATGDDAIWQRWSNYVKNGHGNNRDLKKILCDNGADYSRNFQFSILEVADTHASKNDILDREYHWMKRLKTAEFGYNYSGKK